MMWIVYLLGPVYSSMNGFVFCHQNDHRRRKKTRLSIKTEKADKEKKNFFFLQCNAASIKLCCILNAFESRNEFHFDEASASAN